MQMANICRMFIKTVVRTENVNKSKAGSQTPGIRFLILVIQGIIKNE